MSYIIVDPAFPLPLVLTSTPANFFEKITENDMLPRRYATNPTII